MENKMPLEAHLNAIESAVDHIAYVRRMAEVEGHDMEEFDAEMNKLCDKCHKRYAKMDKLTLMLKGVAEILKGDRADEFLEAMARDLGE